MFTLGGVIVGGMLNYVATAVLEKRRAAGALITTARIVGEELGTNAAALTALATQRFGLAQAAPIQFNAWEHYRHVLAEQLPRNDWTLLRDAIRGMRMIEMERHQSSATPTRSTGPADSKALEEVAASACTAVEMLERYAMRS